MDPSKYDTAGTPQFHTMSPASNASLPNSSILPTDALLARCWGPIRQEIRAWLQRNAPSLAELYEGAVILLYVNPLPGRVRFISQAVREIRNRLPEVISGMKWPQRLDYKSQLDALAKLWRKNGQSFALEETTPPASPTISINRVLYTTIVDLIQTHEETRLTRNEAAQRLFETMAPENRELRVALRPIMRQWLDVTEWFMGNAHDSGRIDGDCDEPHLQGQFELFEATLYGLVGKFFSTVEELDEILEDTNS